MYDISVIIPVFNAENYLNKCLDSVVNQSLGIENIEVIIVDDCSLDDSLKIAKDYANKYDSIKIIEQKENRGPSKARNLGLEHIHSDFVSFLDSDDYIDENTYELCMNKFKEENCDLVIYKYICCDDKGNIFPIDLHQQIYLKNRTIEDINEVPEVIFSTSPANKVYSKKLFKFLNFPSMMYEDNIVAANVIFNSNKICVITDCLYFYMQHTDISRTNIVNKTKIIDLIKVIDQLIDLSKEYPKYGELAIFLGLKFISDINFWFHALNLPFEDLEEIYNHLKPYVEEISDKTISDYNSKFPEFDLFDSWGDEWIDDIKSMDAVNFLFKYIYHDKLANSKIANLYLDLGDGFNEMSKLTIPYNLSGVHSLKFDIRDVTDISKLRFDPIEMEFTRCSIIKINTDAKSVKIIDSNANNSNDSESQLFFNLDPQYLLDGDFTDISYIEFIFKLELIDSRDLNQFIIDLRGDYDLEVANLHSLMNNIILEKDEVIAEKDVGIEERDVVIANLRNELDSIINSNSWKLTKPLRSLKPKK